MEVGGLVLSRRGVDLLVEWETGGRAYYEQRLAKPTWPGGGSGVTVGVGYDLGYHTPAEVLREWSLLGDRAARDLAGACGVRGERARSVARGLAHVHVDWGVALRVFEEVTLPWWCARTREVFPGVERLGPDAQSALVSLVFNRGVSMSGDRRREMRAIARAVSRGDLVEIAAQLRRMKRLWVGKGLDGLLKRREGEAALVEGESKGRGNGSPQRRGGGDGEGEGPC